MRKNKKRSCRGNSKKAQVILAAVLAVGVFALTPALGDSTQKSGMSNLMAEEDSTSQSYDGDYDGTENWQNENPYVMPANTVDQVAPMQQMDQTSTQNSWCVQTETGTECKDQFGNTWNGTSTATPPTNQPMDPMNPMNQQWGQPMGGEGGGQFMNANPNAQDCGADIRDAKRMVNEIEHLIKSQSKTGTDTSSLSSALTEAQSISEKLQTCDTLTWEELNQYRERLHGQDGIQNQLSIFRCWEDYNRQQKDYDRMKRDVEKTKSHLEEAAEMADSSMQNKIDDQLSNLNKILELKQESLSVMKSSECKVYSGQDYETQSELEDIRYEMQDLELETQTFWDEFEQVSETIWATKMFDEVEKEIAKAYETEYKNLPPPMQEKMDSIISVIKELVAKGRQCQKDGNAECVKEVQKRLDEVSRTAGQTFGSPDDYKDLGMGDQANKNLKEVFKDQNFGEASEVINYLLSVDPSLVDKISDPTMAKKMFKILGRVPENMKGEYMTQAGEIESLYSEIITTNKQIETYKNDILGHPFIGQAQKALVSDLTDLRDGKITVEELVSRLEGYRNQSKKAEVENGIAKFEDATSDQWYYDAANDEQFNIQGKNVGGKQVFDASGKTTFAEMLKVMSEALGLGRQEGSSSYGPAIGHWAEGYYTAVEGKGITLMEPGHKITRGEMARLMVEIMGLQAEEVETPFRDLPGNQYAKFIGTLYQYGVINGDADGTSVRPNDTVNRAEAFTMAKNAIDKLQFATVDSTQMENYTKDLESID